MKRFIICIMLLAVMFVTVLPYDKELEALAYPILEGYIKSLNINEFRIEVEEYGGNVRRLNITPGTVLLIDETPAKLGDFKVGMEIYGQYYRDTLTRMESWSTENPGYIPPGGKVRSGIIKILTEIN